MWNQNAIEIWKLVVSVLTPVTIAVFGVLINRTIQRQNAIAQRQSSWHDKWADDFLKTVTAFNDSATSFILLYYSSVLKVTNDFPGAVDEQKLLRNEILPLAIALNRGRLEISKFASFAPISGKGLDEAAESLYAEANNWMKNHGGDVQAFLGKQLAFNTKARKVHAELLGLNNSR
jgi:hypothetical protein